MGQMQHAWMVAGRITRAPPSFFEAIKEGTPLAPRNEEGPSALAWSWIMNAWLLTLEPFVSNKLRNKAMICYLTQERAVV